MAASKVNRFWTLITIFLVVITVIGGILVWSRYSPGQPVEIVLPSSQVQQGRVYIGGAVVNPGFYPFTAGDRLEALIQAAGGATGSADPGELKLYISSVGEEPEAQKIDLNRAELWLLEALPGIGEIRAKAIIDYRQQNGPFRNTNELLKVAGIGATTYERIKSLITVAD